MLADALKSPTASSLPVVGRLFQLRRRQLVAFSSSEVEKVRLLYSMLFDYCC